MHAGGGRSQSSELLLGTQRWLLEPRLHFLPEAPSQKSAPGLGELGMKMKRRKDFFITFLNILLIASSVADVVCLMMHRQEAAPNP